MDFASIVTIIKTTFVLILVIFLANILLKYLNKYNQQSNRAIKIIERVSVFSNSAIGIVEICGAYYLMSFSEKENRILKELDKEEIQAAIEDIRNNQVSLDIKEKVDNYFGMRKKS